MNNPDEEKINHALRWLLAEVILPDNDLYMEFAYQAIRYANIDKYIVTPSTPEEQFLLDEFKIICHFEFMYIATKNTEWLAEKERKLHNLRLSSLIPLKFKCI